MKPVHHLPNAIVMRGANVQGTFQLNSQTLTGMMRVSTQLGDFTVEMYEPLVREILNALGEFSPRGGEAA